MTRAFVGSILLAFLGLQQGCRPAAVSDPRSDSTGTAPPAAAAQDPVRRLVAEEELLLELTPVMQGLERDLRNLQLPADDGRGLLTNDCQFVDCRPQDASPAGSSSDAARHFVAEDQCLSMHPELRLWNPFFESLAYVEHAKLSLVKGHFLDSGWRRFETEVSLSGLARGRDRRWLDLRGSMRLEWTRDGEPSPAATIQATPATAPPALDSTALTRWRIAAWRTESLVLTAADRLQFREVLSEAVPDARQRQPLLESQHWLYAVNHFYPKRAARVDDDINDARFFPISTAYHPGLSVVDVDRDGWDELYVMDRWGQNRLLHNQGDGTFREAAASRGLDVNGRSNAAVFADFDNDGDADLMLARGMERSLYLVNEDGRFVDRSSERVAFALPMEATSVSAADYNGDGLLDVYFSTYHQDDISRRLDADLADPGHRIHATLTPEHSAELQRRFRAETRSFISQVGPPNILLVNQGQGRFALAPENDQVAVWRNSFQATWCDYDQDGDPDLYVANDFAPDSLLRNDGAEGFREVSRESGITRLGFGMGASWSDFDNDGQHDLYVSNMYSKAGRRITRGVDQIDPRIAQLADGNYLYRYEGRQFHLVSGLTPPALTVARAGWAWGGQFFDADNDGFQDLYVSSGYYTVPAPYETKIDL